MCVCVCVCVCARVHVCVALCVGRSKESEAQYILYCILPSRYCTGEQVQYLYIALEAQFPVIHKLHSLDILPVQPAEQVCCI